MRISFVSYSRSSWVDRGCCLCRRILRTGCSRMLSSAGKKGVVFLSGPQLAGKAGQRAREMVAHGAHGIMTGTPDAGSLSAEMLKNGQMLFLRYPVHLDAMQCRELAEKNQFGRVIPYHSPEIDCPCFFFAIIVAMIVLADLLHLVY